MPEDVIRSPIEEKKNKLVITEPTFIVVEYAYLVDSGFMSKMKCFICEETPATKSYICCSFWGRPTVGPVK